VRSKPAIHELQNRPQTAIHDLWNSLEKRIHELGEGLKNTIHENGVEAVGERLGLKNSVLGGSKRSFRPSGAFLTAKRGPETRFMSFWKA